MVRGLCPNSEVLGGERGTGETACSRDAVRQEGLTPGAAMTTSCLPGMQGTGPRAATSC